MNEQRGQWTVMGLCQYADEDHPRFALEADTDTAIEAAIEAMEAVTAGDPEAAEIVARASDLESPSKDGTEADIPSMTAEDSDAGDADSDDGDDATEGSDETGSGQASLTDF